MDFRPDFSDNSIIMRVSKSNFLGKVPKESEESLDFFDFGYCITVHKAQGSEFNNVIIIMDYMPRNIIVRWLFTAVTRAKEGLVIGF